MRVDWVRKPWAITIIVVAVCAIILTPIILYAVRTMREVREPFIQFSSLLVAKKYHEAYVSASPEFHNAISEADFTTQQALLCSHYGTLKRVAIGSSEAECNEFGCSAKLATNFEFEKSKLQFEFRMKKHGKLWQVLGYTQQ